MSMHHPKEGSPILDLSQPLAFFSGHGIALRNNRYDIKPKYTVKVPEKTTVTFWVPASKQLARLPDEVGKLIESGEMEKARKAMSLYVTTEPGYKGPVPVTYDAGDMVENLILLSPEDLELAKPPKGTIQVTMPRAIQRKHAVTAQYGEMTVTAHYQAGANKPRVTRKPRVITDLVKEWKGEWLGNLLQKFAGYHCHWVACRVPTNRMERCVRHSGLVNAA